MYLHTAACIFICSFVHKHCIGLHVFPTVTSDSKMVLCLVCMGCPATIAGKAVHSVVHSVYKHASKPSTCLLRLYQPELLHVAHESFQLPFMVAACHLCDVFMTVSASLTV